MNAAVLLFGSFLLLCFLRVPVAVALLLSAVLAALKEGVDLIIVAQQIRQGLDSFTMLAIPLFLLAGTFMESGGIVSRIAKFADTCVGHITGLWVMWSSCATWCWRVSPVRPPQTPRLWAACSSL